MIKITTIPVSTATQQQLLVEVEECICKKVCVNAGNVLSGTIAFTYGTPTVLNGVAVVPVTATGTIVMAGACGSCESSTRNFAESFEIPFTATTTNEITLTPGTNNVVSFSRVSCCHTSHVKLMTTLTAAIA